MKHALLAILKLNGMKVETGIRLPLTPVDMAVPYREYAPEMSWDVMISLASGSTPGAEAVPYREDAPEMSWDVIRQASGSTPGAEAVPYREYAPEMSWDVISQASGSTPGAEAEINPEWLSDFNEVKGQLAGLSTREILQLAKTSEDGPGDVTARHEFKHSLEALEERAKMAKVFDLVQMKVEEGAPMMTMCDPVLVKLKGDTDKSLNSVEQEKDPFSKELEEVYFSSEGDDDLKSPERDEYLSSSDLDDDDSGLQELKELERHS